MSALRRASGLMGAAVRLGASATGVPQAALVPLSRKMASYGGLSELGSVADILATKGESFYSTRSDALVLDAAKEMVTHNIGSLIILSEDDKPIGIVTEQDLARHVVRGRSAHETHVKEIMSKKAFTSVTPDASLHHCMDLMASVKIRHLPVIEDGKVLGLLSVGDIVKELVAAQKKNAEHMRDFISGGY